jgi:hypothetical protein
MSDPLQLEGEPGIPLFLACHELSRSTDVDLALPGHVARLTALFADDLVLREDFDDLLSAYGYLSVHAAHYVQGYRLGELLAFRVDDDFPRIRLADIPASVVRVQFSIEIQHLRRHAMSADQSIGPAVASEALRP